MARLKFAMLCIFYKEKPWHKYPRPIYIRHLPTLYTHIFELLPDMYVRGKRKKSHQNYIKLQLCTQRKGFLLNNVRIWSSIFHSAVHVESPRWMGDCYTRQCVWRNVLHLARTLIMIGSYNTLYRFRLSDLKYQNQFIGLSMDLY